MQQGMINRSLCKSMQVVHSKKVICCTDLFELFNKVRLTLTALWQGVVSGFSGLIPLSVVFV